MISREEAINELELKRTAAKSTLDSLPPKTREKSALNDEVEMLTMAIEALSQPERPKGRCEYCKDGKTFAGTSIIFCADNKFHKINYCPNCGADMREGEEE